MNLQISGIEYTKEKITFEKMYVEEFYRITCMHPKGLSARYFSRSGEIGYENKGLF